MMDHIQEKKQSRSHPRGHSEPFPISSKKKSGRGRGEGELTGKDMFVYPSKLNVCIAGIRYNQTVDNAFRYRLGDRMAKVCLNLHGATFNVVNVQPSRGANICQNCGADVTKGSRRGADDVCRPAIDKFVKL